MSSCPDTRIALDATARRRLAAAAAMAVAIALGLASRRWPGPLAATFGKYPGDALWALTVFFGLACLRPRAPTWQLAALAGTTCLAVECAKLWQAPWLVHFRRTTPGHLLLGQVFSWANLVAYGVGILAAAALDRRARSRALLRSVS